MNLPWSEITWIKLTSQHDRCPEVSQESSTSSTSTSEDSLCVASLRIPPIWDLVGDLTPLVSSLLLHCIRPISKQKDLVTWYVPCSPPWLPWQRALVQAASCCGEKEKQEKRRQTERKEENRRRETFSNPVPVPVFSPCCKSSLSVLLIQLQLTQMTDSHPLIEINIRRCVFKDFAGDIMWIFCDLLRTRRASPQGDGLCLCALVSVRSSLMSDLYSEQRRGEIKQLYSNKGTSVMWWNSLWCIVSGSKWFSLYFHSCCFKSAVFLSLSKSLSHKQTCLLLCILLWFCLISKSVQIQLGQLVLIGDLICRMSLCFWKQWDFLA